MACDRFVTWKDKRPTKEEVRHVIEDYLGELIVEIKEDRSRFFITLTGKYSHPLKRMKDAHPSLTAAPDEGWEGRYLEVDVAKDCIDVMTRRQDEVTMAIADGLAAVFTRFWQGELDAG